MQLSNDCNKVETAYTHIHILYVLYIHVLHWFCGFLATTEIDLFKQKGILLELNDMFVHVHYIVVSQFYMIVVGK